MSDHIHWGILGTGAIAKTFGKALHHSTTGQLAAVASRSQTSADAYANTIKPGITTHASYDALLADPQVDAVYIATPHTLHAHWAIKAANAGKHVLCEKPSGISEQQTLAMLDAARENNVFFMEGFMYRCHPQTAKLIDLVRTGAIGQVRIINANFGYLATEEDAAWLFDPKLAGGGIMDVGGYPVSLARLIAGIAQGQHFAEPLSLTASGHVGKTGVDEWTTALLTFPGDIIASLSTSITAEQQRNVQIIGSTGWLDVSEPWTFDPEQGKTFTITLHRRDTAPEQITVDCPVTAYTLEADVVGSAIREGKPQPPSPAMSWDDSLGNIRVLEKWRTAIGLSNDFEDAK